MSVPTGDARTNAMVGRVWGVTLFLAMAGVGLLLGWHLFAGFMLGALTGRLWAYVKASGS